MKTYLVTVEVFAQANSEEEACEAVQEQLFKDVSYTNDPDQIGITRWNDTFADEQEDQ
jgi:hypothetical protein